MLRHDRRKATELLVDALGATFPFWQAHIPMLRFVPPLKDVYEGANSLQTERVNVTEITVHLRDCESSSRFTTCQPAVLGHAYLPSSYLHTPGTCVSKENAQLRRKTLGEDNAFAQLRMIHSHPKSAYSTLPCASTRVQSELLGLKMLDYITGHLDRFYPNASNNLFVLSNSQRVSEQRAVSDEHFQLVYIDNEHRGFRVPNATTCEISPFPGLADIYPHLHGWRTVPTHLRRQLCADSPEAHVLSIRRQLGSEWTWVSSVFARSTFIMEHRLFPGASSRHTVLRRFQKVGACSLLKSEGYTGCGGPCHLEQLLRSQLSSLQRFLSC